jgi:hypothetical protein
MTDNQGLRGRIDGAPDRSGVPLCAGLSATVAFGVTDFNSSSDFSTLCQRAWSFFISIGAEKVEELIQLAMDEDKPLTRNH